MTDHTKLIIGFGLCVLMTGVMVYHSYRKPYNNWDEIGYVGSAISWSVKSPIEAQKLTFRFLREATNESTFSENTNTSQYRKSVYRDPGAFALQLPFYKVKPAYVALIWLGWKLGVNPVRATSAISAIAAGFLGLIVAAILVRALGGGAGAAIYPLVVVLGGVASAARFSTPDAESALAVFSGLWLLRGSSIEKIQVGLLLLCLAVAIRPDNVILLLSCALVFGLAEIISNGRTGLLVEPCNSVQLAEVLLNLLDNLARARAMGAAGRAHASRMFSWEATLDKLRLCYERANKRSSSRGSACAGMMNGLPKSDESNEGRCQFSQSG